MTVAEEGDECEVEEAQEWVEVGGEDERRGLRCYS